MRMLVLGGTAWVGHTIAAAGVAAGHDVVCPARGDGVAAGARLVRADRDRDDALAEVSRERWHAVIDVARHPGHVPRAVRDLQGSAERYVFVSSGNVYASQRELGADETAERLAPLPKEVETMTDPDTQYGPAKVACEDAITAAFGDDRSVIARCGLIGGPGDPSGRTGYWPWRFRHAAGAAPEAPVLVPEGPGPDTAIIDVRDLAAWLVAAADPQSGASGAFNVTGTRLLLAEHLALVRQVAGHTGPVVRATDAWLLEHGVSEWAGPRSLPLWLADPDWLGLNARSNARALAAGLRLRPVGETVLDTLRWGVSVAPGKPPGAGLTDAEQSELISALG